MSRAHCLMGLACQSEQGSPKAQQGTHCHVRLYFFVPWCAFVCLAVRCVGVAERCMCVGVRALVLRWPHSVYSETTRKIGTENFANHRHTDFDTIVVHKSKSFWLMLVIDTYCSTIDISIFSLGNCIVEFFSKGNRSSWRFYLSTLTISMRNCILIFEIVLVTSLFVI